MIDYTFYMTDGTLTVQCHPIWKDDMAVEYAYENRQQFMRAALSSELTFIREDYTWIMQHTIEDKITLTIQMSYNGAAAVQAFSGSFHLTDCTINVDDGKIKVKPQTDDRYNKILAGLDKEYDLIKLAPAIQPVEITRRPLLQIYTKDETVVSCFLSSMAWEQDVVIDDASARALRNDYHFGEIGNYVEIVCNAQITGLVAPFTGQWNHGDATGQWTDFSNTEGIYRIDYFQEETHLGDDNFQFTNGLRIYPVNGNDLQWEYKQSVYGTAGHGFSDIPSSITFTPYGSQAADVAATTSETAIFGRYLVAAENLGSYPVPEDDICQYNRNYRYCFPYTEQDVIVMSSDYSTDPTQWGLRPDGKYYQKPAPTMTAFDYHPVARTTWNLASKWCKVNSNTIGIERDKRYEYTLRDAYTLEAVISALLAQIDPTITFSNNQLYSVFLYGTNPIYPYMGKLVMTPKTNVTIAEYTQPAQKAPITLGQVFNMLRDALGLYWFIDDNNHLKIEHLVWFKNGGTYSGTQAVGIDLTSMVVARNGKTLDYAKGEYKFDKIDMPERYQYEWGDATTDVFKGNPIEVLSTYVREGNIEEVAVSNFNPDLDYLMLNPSDVSADGFALLCCNVSGGDYSVPIMTDYIGGVQTDIQNYLLAFYALIPGVLTYDMPAWSIKVNGSTTTAKGIQRKKQQSVGVPMDGGVPNTNQLVKTSLGNGQIKKMSLRLTSRYTKIDLVYDTAEQQS